MADYNSSLPVRTETDGDVVQKIIGNAGVNTAEVNADEELLVHDEKAKDAVDAVATALADGTQVTKVTDGTDELAINADGSINVVFQEGLAGDEVHVFDTTVAGVPNTPATVVDYTVTTGKTLQLKSVHASSSGKAKVEVLTGTPSSEVLQAVSFISTASGQVQIMFPQPIEVDAGDKVLVVITNYDKANADLYAFVNGNEL
jgi:hypothetical protein